MTIEFNEQIRAIWFVQVNSSVDWLAAVQEPAPGKARLVYRFRYYADAEIWDTKDVKNWYAFTGQYPELLNTVREMAELMAEARGARLCELIRGARSLEEFADLFSSQPFAHVKKEPRSAPPT